MKDYLRKGRNDVDEKFARAEKQANLLYLFPLIGRTDYFLNLQVGDQILLMASARFTGGGENYIEEAAVGIWGVGDLLPAPQGLVGKTECECDCEWEIHLAMVRFWILIVRISLGSLVMLIEDWYLTRRRVQHSFPGQTSRGERQLVSKGKGCLSIMDQHRIKGLGEMRI